MKDREINIKVRNIRPKHWTNLVIELNLMADAWIPYGPKMKLKTRNLERIIKWGRSIGDYNRRNRSSRKKVGQDEEFEV